MYTVGTAGHVDHGKSTLVKALTGIDPDRLPVEKEREMTVDLGFAWLTLPSGRQVSIVDVPGHERFIKNMLAGVGGIDLALLVVAADEGVMPQTVEHLEILDLLQVRRGVIVITKIDLVDREWLELVEADVGERVQGTVFAGAPRVAVSALTGEGLDALKDLLDRILGETPPRPDLGRPRLPVDRVFSVAGFGTVVTGTLIDGSLRVGQDVEVLPRGLRSRIRSLQSHRQRVETAGPGRRTAVNLAGVDTADVERGDVVTVPGWLKPTDVVDVQLRAVRYIDRPIVHNLEVSFHTGAAEVIGRLRLLDRDELLPGDMGWAQIKLSEKVAVVPGDHFIIRSPNETLGGGRIIDTAPRRHRRFHGPTLAALAARAGDSPAARIRQLVAELEPVTTARLAERSGLTIEQVRATVDELKKAGEVVVLDGSELVLTPASLQRLRTQCLDLVSAYHAQFPFRAGIPREELKSRLKVPDEVFEALVGGLVAEGRLRERGTMLARSDFGVQLTAEQQAKIEKFLAELAANPFSPQPTEPLEPELLGLLADQGKVVKLAENVVLTAEAYRQMTEKVVDYLVKHGRVTVAQVRDMFGTSRKYALALMEHLDDRRITRRVGDERVLIRRPGG
jgi:selenocysteine-specific elongation factor